MLWYFDPNSRVPRLHCLTLNLEVNRTESKRKKEKKHVVAGPIYDGMNAPATSLTESAERNRFVWPALSSELDSE